MGLEFPLILMILVGTHVVPELENYLSLDAAVWIIFLTQVAISKYFKVK
jgi:hypothetical protein